MRSLELTIASLFVGGLLIASPGCDDPAPPVKTAKESEPPAADADEDGEAGEAKAKAKAKPKKAKAKAKPKGPKYTCNVCGSTTVFADAGARKSASCPVCKCSERHRLLIHYLDNASTLLEEKLDVLHVSPQECEETALRHQPNWHYVTSDYLHDEDLRLDLTNADQPDASWDLIILYHIFEHIEDDQKAMSETFRLLRPGGRAIIQVPLEEGVTEIYEDPTITSRAERHKHFGQGDHVRKYSPDGLRERLEAAGFQVEAVDYLGTLDPAVVEKHKLSGDFEPPLDESIWIATKPKK